MAKKRIFGVAMLLLVLLGTISFRVLADRPLIADPQQTPFSGDEPGRGCGTACALSHRAKVVRCTLLRGRRCYFSTTFQWHRLGKQRKLPVCPQRKRISQFCSLVPGWQYNRETLPGLLQYQRRERGFVPDPLQRAWDTDRSHQHEYHPE